MPRERLLALLGLPSDATPHAIKHRYRELARRLHPDVNQTDERAQARFRAVTAAYERLLDEPDDVPALPPSVSVAQTPTAPSSSNAQTPAAPGPSSRADLPRAIPIEVTLAQVIEGVQLGVGLPDGRVVLIDVPPGADTGTLLRRAGSDAMVEVRVVPDSTYVRRGTDLHVRVSITADVAWKGTRLELDTPSGRVRVLVPERSRHGDVIRVVAPWRARTT